MGDYGESSKFVAQLKDSKADVLLAPFHTVDMLSGEKRAYSIEGPEPGRLYSMDEIARWYPAAAGWFSFHSVFYRRDFYEKLHIELSEKIFYEDTEYSVLPSANGADRGNSEVLFLSVYDWKRRSERIHKKLCKTGKAS